MDTAALAREAREQADEAQRLARRARWAAIVGLTCSVLGLILQLIGRFA